MLLEQQATQLESLPHMLQEANRLQAAGKTQQAREMAERIVRLDPTQDNAFNLLGLQAAQAGQVELAADWFAKAASANPKNPLHISNLAALLITLGRLEPALAHLERALAMDPSADIHNNMGAVLEKMHRLPDAVVHYKKAVQRAPSNAAMWNNLGFALISLGQLDDADATMARALALAPENPDVLLNLGALRIKQGRPIEGRDILLRILTLAPKQGAVQGGAHVNLSNLSFGNNEKASATYHLRRAMELTTGPLRVDIASGLLFSMAQEASTSAAELFQEHLAFSEAFESELLALHQAHTNDKNPNRCIRVALVSADLRSHSVAYFLQPLLSDLASLPGFELHAYSNSGHADSVTDRMKPNFASWTEVHQMSDDELAQRIRTDGTDILIDLSGHTSGHRLLAFARKPAPVQVSWMGYPGTTGLRSMDYYFADKHFLPPGLMDDQFTEKIVQLPASVVFQPAPNAPPVNALPALTNGHITFGSFSHLRKINRQVIALWSELMRQTPSSHLLMGGMPKGDSNTIVRAWFLEESIDESRVRFHETCPLSEYLELHNEVDIHLDPFPYNGGTTSLHAVWMGVPTLTLSGMLPSNRQGASIAGHMGLPQFVTYSSSEFVQQGVYWSEHLGELAQLRDGMRARFQKSAFGNSQAVAAGIDQALRTMWQAWCEGTAPKSFMVESDVQGR